LVGKPLSSHVHFLHKHDCGIGYFDEIEAKAGVEKRAVLFANAVVQPQAVVVKGGHALAAVIAVLHPE
jgi:hypothetical protein